MRFRAQAFLTSGDDPAGVASGDNTGWALVSHGIGEKLFTLNSAGEFVAELASAMPVKKSDGSWTVTLASGHKFSDGSAVTAEDVATSLKRTNQHLSNAQSSAGTMTIEATGPLTLKITTTKSTPVLNAVLAEWWAVVYKVNLLSFGLDQFQE